MAAPHPIATVIGDVVGSKSAADRAAVHRRLTAALATINAYAGDRRPVTPLWITAGDEYQGCFTTVGAALHATFRLRLALAPDVDVRHGVGWGVVSVLGKRPHVEDGPGWWAARQAIQEVAAAQGRSGSRARRTGYVRAVDLVGGHDRTVADRLATEPTGPEPATINAALIARDQLLSDAGAESLSVLTDMLAGMNQKQIAAALGISASAVSQRVRRDGLAALVEVDRLLGTAT